MGKDPQKVDGEYRCPSCGGVLHVRERLFYWRNIYYSGLYCEPCNAMWGNPEDSFMEGVKRTATEAVK